jgi:lysophospholipase L1-like esterase
MIAALRRESQPRSRPNGHAYALILALIALAALALAPAAGAWNGPPVSRAPVSTYLALGDSISFGYSEQVFNENAPNESPSYFEEGFTNVFALDLARGSEVGRGLTLVNDACPGETSNGLIGENPALGGKASTEPAGHDPQGLGDYHPCAYNNVDGLPLHNSLSVGGQSISQLEDALSILKEGHPAHPVQAITLNIGSNDELAAIAQCQNEVTEEFTTTGKSKYGASPEAAAVACIQVTSEKVTAPHILANIADIIGVLDSTAPGGGHYTGPIVLVGFYNPDALVLPGSDALQQGLDAAVEAEILPHFPNVSFANPFPVFNRGSSPELEQASICKYTEMCNPNDPGGSKDDGDIHPSPLGYGVLGWLVNQAYLDNPANPNHPSSPIHPIYPGHPGHSRNSGHSGRPGGSGHPGHSGHHPGGSGGLSHY